MSEQKDLAAVDVLLAGADIQTLLTIPAVRAVLEQHVTAYKFNALPAEVTDERERLHFDVKVEWRGHGLYAVTHGGEVWHKKGEWDWEPSPSNRGKNFLKTHRFSLDEAIKIAKKVAPHVSMNGFTPENYLERMARHVAAVEAAEKAAR